MTRALRWVTAAVVAGAGGCGHGGDDHSAITPEELAAHVEALGSEGEEEASAPGSRYDVAAAYVARTLELARVTPGVQEPEGHPGFLQPVPLIRNLVGDGSMLEVTTARGTKRVPEGRRTFLLIAPGKAGQAVPSRPPVFVGNGIHAPEHGVDDLAGLDLAGRPVLMTATPPDPKALAAMPDEVRSLYSDSDAAQYRRMSDLIDRGAAFVLLVPERWLLDEWDAMSAMRRRLDYAPVEQYGGQILQSPIPIVLIHADLVDWLFIGRSYHPISHVGTYGSFEIDGFSIGLEIDVRREPRVTANVLGVVPGDDRTLRDEYVIVSAQLDGASSDDKSVAVEDAAACAALLEVAGAIARERPRRSVLLVFSIVEGGGAWGSLHLMAHLPVPREAVAAAIHVKRVGHPDAPFQTLEAMAAPPALAKEVEGAARRGRLEVTTSSRGVGAFKGTPAEVFLLAGIPSMLVTIREPAMADADEDDDAGSSGLIEATHLLRLLVAETANARSLAEARPKDADVGLAR